MSTESTYQATGRRKNAVARVRVTRGSGKIEINGKPFDEYFPTPSLQNQVLMPFLAVQGTNSWDVAGKATGGGPVGQAGAVRLAIARALVQSDETFRPALRADGLLTRDPRMKERKKAGQPGARRRYQFSKR